ncbi:uncharacterized protein FTOL_08942 [Fusarium torulosum]|uniref:Uncharacterized protein n=1 Tax=Fusarium torulosum TaxID=33205 RepID=A0AAE8MDL9_9HYPO|nr:uncharacterized protein FTOL_08942 [Fusarium torulosum]
MSAPPNFQAFESRPPSSPFVSESAHVFSLQHPTVTLFPNINQGSVDISPSIGSTDSISPMNGSEKARGTSTPPSSSPSSGGLYDRAKRSLESKFKLRVRIEEPRCPSIPEHEQHVSTTNDAQNYSSLHQVTKTGAWLKDNTSKPGLRRKLFGRAPWVRKESGDSFSSVTSSMREILKGETPPPSLVSSRSSLRVDCVDSQFPGGEARRIKTPPLAEDTASGHPRSFFTETVAPVEHDHQETHSSSSSRHDSLQTVCHRSHVTDISEWWEKIPKKPIRRNPFEEPIPFEFQLPEHLPNSPMCPANEKHVSGGTGVCVYHGRRKGSSKLRAGCEFHGV